MEGRRWIVRSGFYFTLEDQGQSYRKENFEQSLEGTESEQCDHKKPVRNKKCKEITHFWTHRLYIYLLATRLEFNFRRERIGFSERLKKKLPNNCLYYRMEVVLS